MYWGGLRRGDVEGGRREIERSDITCMNECMHESYL